MLRSQDVIKYSLVGLSERKFRFSLNIIGIMIGCMAIIGLIGLTEGLSVNIDEQLGSLGTNTITVVTARTQGPQAQFETGSELDWRDVEIIERLVHVELVSPLISGKIGEYTTRGGSFSSSVIGVDTNYFIINEAIEIEDGRFFSRGDSNVAILGSNIVSPNGDEVLFDLGDRLRLGSTVDGETKSQTLRVVGILKESGGTFSADPDNSIYIPITTFEQFYGTGRNYSTIQVLVDSQDKVALVSMMIEDQVEQSRAITAASLSETVGLVTNSIQSVLAGVAAISLLVAGVGIINTMTVSVLERTKEIGVLKALGAKSFDVLGMFLFEAMATGFTGGMLGVVVGYYVSILVGRIVEIEPSISFSLVLFVIGFAIITSGLAGLYPAWNASKLTPVDALRQE